MNCCIRINLINTFLCKNNFKPYICFILKNNKLIKNKSIHTSNATCLFWEKDHKGGYKSDKKIPKKELIRNGLKELKHEINLWKDEVKEKLLADPIIAFRPGETDIVWQFSDKQSLAQWVTTSDSDHNEGKSTCSLDLNPQGRGVFSGILNKEVPKDGRTRKAGYCNMKSIRARKSFKRDKYLDWTMYNMLVMKIRGDGRSYLLNISTEGYYDVWWHDIYHYILFTRGGPYWQLVKIPFSKFFLASKGRVQDRQAPIPLNRITSFGISAGDRIDGPFRLEIDYIGVEFDPNHTEEFAYEMYKMKQKYIVAN